MNAPKEQRSTRFEPAGVGPCPVDVMMDISEASDRKPINGAALMCDALKSPDGSTGLGVFSSGSGIASSLI